MALSRLWPFKYPPNVAPLEFKLDFSVSGKTLLDFLKTAAAQIDYTFNTYDKSGGRQVLIRQQAMFISEQALVVENIKIDEAYGSFVVNVQNFFLTKKRWHQYEQALQEFEKTINSLFESYASSTQSF